MNSATQSTALPDLPSSCSHEQVQSFRDEIKELLELNKKWQNGDISPFEHGRSREESLAKALWVMASCYGVLLKRPIAIDSRGDISITAEEPDRYGTYFSALLSLFKTRSGAIEYGHHKREVLPENNWCFMNHFEVERMVMTFHEQLDIIS